MSELDPRETRILELEGQVRSLRIELKTAELQIVEMTLMTIREKYPVLKAELEALKNGN